MENKPHYYAVIPASVRYDSELPGGAKLLYGEISALTNKENYCWASNEYFANLYQVHKDTIDRWVSQLSKRGHIILKTFPKKTGTGGSSRQICLGLSAKMPISIGKNAYHLEEKIPIGGLVEPQNNPMASLNITSNTTIKREMEFPNENSPFRETQGQEETTEGVMVREEIDDDGNPVVPRARKAPRERKNVIALQLLRDFSDLYFKRFKTRPMDSPKAYFITVRTLKHLTEDQIRRLFKDWVYSDKAVEDLIQITQALSHVNINRFKAINRI